MTLGSILSLVLSNPQAIEETVSRLVNMFKATTAPTHVDVPATPAVPDIGAPATPAITKKPSDAIKQVQHLLNQFVKPTPPLAEDGWLGPRTEKAITDGIALAKPYLSMFGG
jgi:hypothetical protein